MCEKKNLYIFPSVAIDPKNIEKIFGSVKDIIFNQNLGPVLN